MKFILVILMLLLSFPAFSFGKVESSSTEDIIIIESNLDGQFVVLPKDHLTTIINLNKATLTFQYGAENKEIRTMKFKQRSSVLKILKQLYPDGYLLSLNGLSDIDWEEVMGGKDKIEAESK